MGNPGFNVGRKRYNEFAEHVRKLEAHPPTWLAEFGHKIQKSYGELAFIGPSVYSYELHIGQVWLEPKIIVYNLEAKGRSKTTNVHMGAIMCCTFKLKEYKLIGASTKDMDKSPWEVARIKWRSDITDAEALDFMMFQDFIFNEKDHDKLMREYVEGDQQHRENMRGLLEMAREGE